MESLTANHRLARVAGAVGIAGQFVGAYVFILVPALTVPSPANYAFFVAWFVLIALALVWWRDRPWRSFLIPITSIPIALLLIAIGTQFAGWAP